MNGHAAYSEVQNMGQESLVVQHASLVKRIAYHLVNRLPPNVQVDDLIQAGMVGLLEAGSHFDATQGASFETYAGIRIRGSMLDEMRRCDWTPRSVHRKAREIAEVVRQIENRTGHDAKDAEVAAALGVSLVDYHHMLMDATASRIFSIEADDGTGIETVHSDSAAGPLDILKSGDFQRALAKEIDRLPDRERLVMSLYYTDEMNLREIGEILEVSESRVCQIHGQAALRLRARLGDWVS